MRHMETHIPKKERRIYQCNQCKLTFVSRINLRHHAEKCRNDDGSFLGELKCERLSCNICPGISFTGRLEASKHMQGHIVLSSLSDELKCEPCNKNFKKRRDIMRHMETHIPMKERKRYECNQCQQTFVNRSYLKYHKARCKKEWDLGPQMSLGMRTQPKPTKQDLVNKYQPKG